MAADEEAECILPRSVGATVGSDGFQPGFGGEEAARGMVPRQGPPVHQEVVSAEHEIDVLDACASDALDGVTDAGGETVDDEPIFDRAGALKADASATRRTTRRERSMMSV